MEALGGREFAQWLRAYHDLNPGAVFPQLSLLVDALGRSSYEILVETAVDASPSFEAPAVLDLGCGDGMLLALYGARVPNAKLVGVDQSGGELEIARATLRPFDAELKRNDIARLDVDAGCIDVAMSHMVIMLVEDPLEALRETARVLKPDGSLCFVVGGIGSPRGILERAAAETGALLKNESKRLPVLDHRLRELDTLAALPWDAIGFADVTVRPIELSRKLSMEQLRSFIAQMYGPMMLSEGGRERLERAIGEAAWEFADENAMVPTSLTLALVIARRT